MPLPDFMIIGAMKGGTDAAAHNLALHPDVWLVDDAAKQAMGDSLVNPEMHFFDIDERWNRGKAWYERFFEAGEGHRLRGEKTPDYLPRLEVHSRMFETVPSARLIVLLREPVARAFSHWRHMVDLRPHWDRLGLSGMSFDDAVRCAFDRARKWRRPPDLLWKGCYAEQIDHLLDWYPREQLLICISERVRARMEEEYARMFAFLGARPLLNVRYSEAHVRQRDEDVAPEPDTLRALTDFYAGHNARLFERLGEVPAEWSRAQQGWR